MITMNTEQMTWSKVVNCVNTELFPVLSIALKKCIDEKLSDDPDFKMSDFQEVVVKDIFERLKEKRTMNNKEIQYLYTLIQRALTSQEEPQSLVMIPQSMSHLQFITCHNLSCRIRESRYDNRTSVQGFQSQMAGTDDKYFIRYLWSPQSSVIRSNAKKGVHGE